MAQQLRKPKMTESTINITHGSPEECNTCGGTGEWETTTEDSPDELVSLGPCPDC